MSYQDGLKLVYYICGKSFQAISDFHQMPISRILLMANVHVEAVEAEKAAYEKARKKK